jgi:hypothetical protein
VCCVSFQCTVILSVFRFMFICVFVFVLNFFVVFIVVVVVASVFIIVSSGFSINSKTSPNTPLLHRLILGQVV